MTLVLVTWKYLLIRQLKGGDSVKKLNQVLIRNVTKLQGSFTSSTIYQLK